MKVTKGPVVWSDLLLSYTTTDYGRFSFEFWNSSKINDSFRNASGNEADYKLMWDKDVVKDTNLLIGFNHIDCQPLFSGHEGDINEIFVEVRHDLHFGKNTISPFLRAELNQLIGPGSASSDYFVGAYSNWIIRPGLSLNSKLAVLIDDGRGLDSGALILYYGALSYKISEHFSLNILDIKSTVPFVGMDDRDGAEVVGGAGIVGTF